METFIMLDGILDRLPNQLQFISEDGGSLSLDTELLGNYIRLMTPKFPVKKGASDKLKEAIEEEWEMEDFIKEFEESILITFRIYGPWSNGDIRPFNSEETELEEGEFWGIDSKVYPISALSELLTPTEYHSLLVKAIKWNIGRINDTEQKDLPKAKFKLQEVDLVIFENHYENDEGAQVAPRFRIEGIKGLELLSQDSITVGNTGKYRKPAVPSAPSEKAEKSNKNQRSRSQNRSVAADKF